MSQQTPPTPPATAQQPGQATITTTQARHGQHIVKTLTGHQLDLQTAEEKTFYEEARDKYLKENVFSAASDLRGLDRLLFFETQMFRWQWQLSIGLDYDYNLLEAADETKIRRNVKETAPLIAQIQNDLGLTKSQREKDKHESVGAYLTQLQQAAKEHGIRREKQLGKAIELTKELFNLAGTYRRSNESERKKLGYESAEDIVTWVLEYMKPEFDAVDDHFRKNQQKFWLRKI